MATLRSIRLLVSDYPAAFAFYRDVLGFKVLWGDEHGPYADFAAAEGVTISLFQNELMMSLLEEEGGEAGPSDSFMLILKADESVDKEDERLAVTAIIPPTDREEWGVRAAQYRDPVGTLLEINKGFDE
ncbi:MAG TPA: VOC family protein [Allosphingosinicella sp.]|nr:VOC family protein [Allosphingosinicella sp.]